MIGQFEAPVPPTPANLTLDNLVRYLVVPWLVLTALDRAGLIKHIPWREAFSAPRPRRRRR